MKKIVFVINRLIKSGPVDIVYNIVKNIDREIYEPIILVLRKKEEYRSVLDDFSKLNINVVFLNFNFFQMEAGFKKCSNTLDDFFIQNSIKIAHAHSYQAVILLSKCSSLSKKIVTFHNICGQDFLRTKGLFLGTYMSCRYLKNARAFDIKIAISEVGARYYKSKLHDETILTVYNGVDCSKFKFVTEQSRALSREKLGIVKQQEVYLIVGTLSKLKNVLYVIDIAKKIIDKNKVFYFVGTGKLLKKCKKKSAGYDNIRVVGYKMDVSDYINSADFSIAASKSEGFGLAAMEVVLSGITLIYSDCPAFKELFCKQEELKPYMFSLLNKNSLLEKINSCKKLTDNEFISEYFREKFNSEDMAKRYQALY